MNDTEINEAIEAALGNTVVDGRRVALWPHPRTGEPEIKHESAIPDYANSLDACAEFEKTIRTEDDRNLYNCELDEFIREANFSAVDHHFLLTTATPLQRCEAYLRMKGLWNERHA